MTFEVLATTAGVALLMGVLPRTLFALRLGRAEGLSQAGALALLLVASLLAVFGAWRGHLPTVAANLAAAASALAYLVLHERCEAIQRERSAMQAKLRSVRPQPRRLRLRT